MDAIFACILSVVAGLAIYAGLLLLAEFFAWML